MTQSFWLFGSCLTILADPTTTGGQYSCSRAIASVIDGRNKIKMHRKKLHFYCVLTVNT
ncbi:MAG: hypothetical protein KME40_29645 [Komarekiella atlantica HA4396-MV6]|jgi:hypothetical protein|nr:hypothetical protein [Komarekiella atlantica HA4396-MV6]